MVTRTSVYEAVAAVPDPELPMVTIADLGILRAVEETPAGVTVRITPTYSGCPAVDTIRDDILAALAPMPATVEVVLAPAWTTDDISATGRAELAAHGIAPPGPVPVGGSAGGPVALTLAVRCPQCGSHQTRRRSRFGSTACKELWVCDACAEPFDRFREHG